MAQNMGKIKQMMDMVKGASNPQGMLNMMAMNNPQLKKVMEIVDQYGGDSMKAFRETAEQMGINPDEIMGMMK